MLTITLHGRVDIEQKNKQKSSVVLDYNETKFGADAIDPMARNYTCEIAERRWPLQVYMYVCHFLIQVAEELMSSRNQIKNIPEDTTAL